MDFFLYGLSWIGIYLLLLPLKLPIACYSGPVFLVNQWTIKSLKEKIFGIWKQIWQLLCARKDFSLFQIGFMFGGAGLMIMHPALPQFFLDELHLSFVEMGCATALCKGIGVVCTSPLWAKFFRRVHLFHFNAIVTFFACLFPFLLLASNWHLWLLYIAYLIYGMMQAGSEMSWHMSSLVFAEKQDSSLFSMTNMLTVGLRGCVIPLFGSYLLSQMPSLGIILLGAFFCLIASAIFALNARHAPAFSR